MDSHYRLLTLGIPWTQSMPSRDVNAAMRFAEVSWRRDNLVHIAHHIAMIFIESRLIIFNKSNLQTNILRFGKRQYSEHFRKDNKSKGVKCLSLNKINMNDIKVTVALATRQIWGMRRLEVSKSSKIKVWNVTNFKKQNRSTEGCSKLKRSVDMTSSGKNGLKITSSKI